LTDLESNTELYGELIEIIQTYITIVVFKLRWEWREYFAYLFLCTNQSLEVILIPACCFLLMMSNT